MEVLKNLDCILPSLWSFEKIALPHDDEGNLIQRKPRLLKCEMWKQDPYKKHSDKTSVVSSL